METTSTESLLPTPLAEAHAISGAKIGSWFGCALPDDFGDWRSEYQFARKTVALIDKNYRMYVSFSGPDRVRYLNAILTNNVKDLQTAHGIASLLLNAQGHILAEIETYALPDKLFCISYAMIRERLIPTLDKYIIMDDVTLADETPHFGTLALEGPFAPRLVLELTGIDLNALMDLVRTQAHVGDIPCTIVRRSPGRSIAADFLVERPHIAPLWHFLLERTRAAGGGPAGYTAVSALRLEQGVPWFGYDFGEKQIPHEAGLEDSHLSYTKGCYTGQEIVERVRSRGQVNRKRVHLIFAGTSVPSAGEPLLADGKEVGYVTRAAAPPSLPFAIGMGYVRKEYNSPGTQLRWSGGTLVVSQFPGELPHEPTAPDTLS